jgi:hypothetical protein
LLKTEWSAVVITFVRGKGVASALRRPFRRLDVVAIRADVFPAERSDVGQQRVGQDFALNAKLGDGAAEIDGVPKGDGGASLSWLG